MPRLPPGTYNPTCCVMLAAQGSSSTACSSEETEGGAHTLCALLMASVKFSSCKGPSRGMGRGGQE